MWRDDSRSSACNDQSRLNSRTHNQELTDAPCQSACDDQPNVMPGRARMNNVLDEMSVLLSAAKNRGKMLKGF